MVRIRLDAEVCQQPDGGAKPVEVCDATGRAIGQFLPDGIPAVIKPGVPPADLPIPLTAEELAVRRQSRTLEEILRDRGQR